MKTIQVKINGDDMAEMLFICLSNISVKGWEKQTEEWKKKTKHWMDEYTRLVDESEEECEHEWTEFGGEWFECNKCGSTEHESIHKPKQKIEKLETEDGYNDLSKCETNRVKINEIIDYINKESK